MSVWHGPFGRSAGYRAAREMLADGRFDAVFVASDQQALGVIRALQELGVRCPDEVAIASFDGIAASAYATPALTTMAQPFAELGRTAVARLLERIGDGTTGGSGMDAAAAGSDDSMLAVELVRRGSCGCDDPPGGGVDHGEALA
jgi:LacI family transcriptional regulator